MLTSSKSSLKFLFELSKTTLTPARFTLAPSPPPLKIKSSPLFPLIAFIDCSPRTKRNPSATFDLPEPFGPTIADIGELKLSVAFLAKDLNPEISKDFRYILIF